MAKFQILYVHGGMTFEMKEAHLDYLKNKNARLDRKVYWDGDFLDRELGENFQIVRPRMPCADNASYEEWQIVFENYLNAMGDNVILMGWSLGGIFLAKYLSENKVDKKILAVYLVAAPFDGSLSDEDLAGGFELGDDLSLIEKNCDRVAMMFSKDDECVTIAHAEKYREKLRKSEIIIYDEKNGHFDIEEFPEIVEMIREDVKKFL